VPLKQTATCGLRKRVAQSNGEEKAALCRSWTRCGCFIFIPSAGRSHCPFSRSNSRQRARRTSELRHLLYFSSFVDAMVAKCAPCRSSDRQKAPGSDSLRWRWCSAGGTSIAPRIGSAGITSTSSFWMM